MTLNEILLQLLNELYKQRLKNVITSYSLLLFYSIYQTIKQNIRFYFFFKLELYFKCKYNYLNFNNFLFKILSKQKKNLYFLTIKNLYILNSITNKSNNNLGMIHFTNLNSLQVGNNFYSFNTYQSYNHVNENYFK